MADFLGDYYKQLETLNQQRGMTGNQALNRGVDASLAEGYLDTQNTNRQKEEQLNLQKGDQALRQDAADTAKSGQTNALIGQAVGGAANLGMQAYQISKKSDWMGKLAGGQDAGGYGSSAPQINIGQPGQSFNSTELDYINKGTEFNEAAPSTWVSFSQGAGDMYKGVTDWFSNLFDFA